MAADFLLNSQLEDLNKSFDAEQWLRENFGCEFFPSSNGWLNTCCPFEDHEDSSPSFGINNDEGCFNCFGCSRNGDFIALVSKLLHFNFHQTVNVISEFCGFDINKVDSLQNSAEKLKKILNDENKAHDKRKKIVLKATYFIKKVQKTDFDRAERLYETLDNLIKEDQYNLIEEKIYGTT